MNKWVEHIKEWAKKNNTTYGCALTDIKCKEDYYKIKGIEKKATTKETKLEKGIEKKATPKETNLEKGIEKKATPKEDKNIIKEKEKELKQIANEYKLMMDAKQEKEKKLGMKINFEEGRDPSYYSYRYRSIKNYLTKQTDKIYPNFDYLTDEKQKEAKIKELESSLEFNSNRYEDLVFDELKSKSITEKNKQFTLSNEALVYLKKYNEIKKELEKLSNKTYPEVQTIDQLKKELKRWDNFLKKLKQKKSTII
jgi:hypothetical protein